MAEHAESEVEIDGAKIRVRRAGKGPALVLLGDMLGPVGWTPFMDMLAQHNAVIAPEYPGFGGAKIPEWLDNISDLANFYLDFLDAEKLDRVHLVGFGIGGWISADLATRSTAHIASLTLVNAAGLHVRGVPQTDIFLGSEDEVLRELIKDQEFAERLIDEFLTPETEDIRLQDQEVLARTTWQPRLNDPNLRKWLHRINVPTHIIWSDDNQLFPKAYGGAWQKLISGAQLSTIAVCGHLAQFEKPQETVQNVTRFISQLRA